MFDHQVIYLSRGTGDSSSKRQCCHHGTAIWRVHPVRLMNVEQCQAAMP